MYYGAPPTPHLPSDHLHITVLAALSFSYGLRPHSLCICVRELYVSICPLTIWQHSLSMQFRLKLTTSQWSSPPLWSVLSALLIPDIHLYSPAVTSLSLHLDVTLVPPSLPLVDWLKPWPMPDWGLMPISSLESPIMTRPNRNETSNKPFQMKPKSQIMADKSATTGPESFKIGSGQQFD